MDVNSYNYLSQKAKDAELIEAAKNNQITLLQSLIQSKANINATDNKGDTALMWAAKKGHIEIVKLLINAQVDLDEGDDWGDTAVMLAAREGHTEIVKLLVDAKADIDSSNCACENAITLASIGGYTEIVNLLIDPHSTKVLAIAAMQGCDDIMQLLIDAKANLEAIDDLHDGDSRMNALMLAAEQGRPQIVRMLISAKVNLDVTDTGGYTALMIATMDGNLDIVKLLIEAKANVNLINREEENALLIAIRNGYTEIVQLLIKANADLRITSPSGKNALSVALLEKKLHTACSVLYVMTEEQIKNALEAHCNNADLKATLEQCKALISTSRKDLLTIVRDDIIKTENNLPAPYFPLEIMAKQLVLRFPIWTKEQLELELNQAWKQIGEWRESRKNSFVPSFNNQCQQAGKRKQQDENDMDTPTQEEPEFKKRRKG